MGEEVGLAVVELSGVGVVDGMERVTERDGEDGPPPLLGLALMVLEVVGGCGWGGIIVDVACVEVVILLLLRSDEDDDEGKEVWRWRGVGWLGRIFGLVVRIDEDK